MNNVSYADVFGIQHAEHGEDIRSGDLVRTGANMFPHFHVVAVAGEKAWLRNTQTGADSILPVNRCRRVNAPPVGPLPAA